MTTTCGPVGVSFVKELGADEIVDISGEGVIDKFLASLDFIHNEPSIDTMMVGDKITDSSVFLLSISTLSICW